MVECEVGGGDVGGEFWGLYVVDYEWEVGEYGLLGGE